jgi:hypothetical protein
VQPIAAGFVKPQYLNQLIGEKHEKEKKRTPGEKQIYKNTFKLSPKSLI